MKFLPFIWRNLTRNVLRTSLTCAAIALAICLVCLLRTMPAGLDALLTDVASNTRIAVHHRAGLTYMLPYAYLHKVRELPGVVSAASWTWYGGVVEKEPGASVASFAVDSDTFGEVWADWHLDPKALEDFRRNRNAAIVGRGVLQQYGWRIGDLVSLRSTVVPVELEFRIVGEVPDVRSPHFFFEREYLVQALHGGDITTDRLGLIWVRVDDPDRVGPLMSQIDELFSNSEAETASETEKGYFSTLFGMLEGFVTLILLVTVLVTVCVVFVAANTASMSVRERAAEIAVLRALGFGRKLVFGTLLAEAIILSILGGAFGAGASLGLTLLLRTLAKGWDSQLGPLAFFVVTDAILVQGFFLALFIGMLSGAIPSVAAVRRSVTATLRDVF